jgi:glycerophosphoryl diester phosphodiesterase
MSTSIQSIFSIAFGDLRRTWRSMAITDLAYKLIAFAILMPATTWLLYWLRSGTSDRVIADVDIALFFFTTPAGIVTLILGGALIIAITAVETSCLIAIGLGLKQGVTLNARAALRFAAAHALNVVRMTLRMVLRILAALVPFAAAGGIVYFTLLKEHDINFYISSHPPEFWAAAGIVAVIVIGLVVLLARTVARWALVMPLLLFEKLTPRQVFGESAKRAQGSHKLILGTLAAWAVTAIVLVSTPAWLVDVLGRMVAPQLSDSLPLLLLFAAALVLIGVVLSLAVGIFNFSMFSLLITHLYLRVGGPKLPVAVLGKYASDGPRRLSPRMIAGIVAASLLAAVGVGLFGFLANRNQSPALIIAHRGSSATAPENTLASFRLAAEQHTDFIELDVQESADGQVLVVHDSDLMKVGGNPTKIWDGTAANLRSVDIGSSKGPRYSGEHVPTLSEALDACRGRCRVIVELKSYGHDQQLEERVAAVVEESGMVSDCIFMSLDRNMVHKMKALRPSWKVGLLVAKAIGDLTELKADFLAVEARMASRSFVERAHAAGQDVYIWTVNDPAWMFVALSRGVDGLITDKPDLARRVVERRAQMSEPQRFLAALLIRFGATTDSLAAEDALRP